MKAIEGGIFNRNGLVGVSMDRMERLSGTHQRNFKEEEGTQKMLATRPRESQRQPMPLISLNPRERSRYSISRAILAANEICSGHQPSRSFELEISDEINQNLPHSIVGRGGLWIPTFMTRGGLDSKSPTKGTEMLFVEPGSLIDALRKRTVVIALGARLLFGLKGIGSVGFPKLTGSAEAEWVAENSGSDIADSSATTDLIPLQPQTLMASTSFSRNLLVQATPGIDDMVTGDIAQVNARAVDRAAIHGTGASNEPTGIYAASDVNPVVFDGPITFAKVVEMETVIATANAETGPMAYVTTPEIREKAKLTPELAGSPIRLWKADEMNDSPAEATNQVSKTLGAGSEHGIVEGVWSELIIGEWGAMEVVTDPYRLKKEGMIELTTFLLAGMAIRHGQAFSKGTGLTVS